MNDDEKSNDMLNEMIITELPFLKNRYLEEVNWHRGYHIGSHVIYGDVLTLYLVECIEKKRTDETAQVFDFVEKVLLLNDPYGNNVIWCSVLEMVVYMIDEYGLNDLLGTETKKMCQDIKEQDKKYSEYKKKLTNGDDKWGRG